MTEGARETDGGAALSGAVAAGTVHDLCNALTVVLGSLEQLRRQRPSLDARGRQQLDRARWGARLAGRLTREFLASGRGECTSSGSGAEVVTAPGQGATTVRLTLPRAEAG